MHFSTVVAFGLPILGAVAMPKPQATTVTSTAAAPTSTPTDPYAVIALRSASPIHFLPINAADQKLWIGRDTASACPIADTTQCPPGNVTVFSGLCSLAVEVPGGQRLYVTPDGAFGFVEAHTDNFPADSVQCPLVYTPETNGEDAYLTTNAFGATSFMACPTSENVYQVFANLPNATVPSGNIDDCLGFDGLASTYPDQFGAWQYE